MSSEASNAVGTKGLRFVVQEYLARSLHFDFKVENGGVFNSWAGLQGLPNAVGAKRLAIQIEDRLLEFGDFGRMIPHGVSGDGQIRVWEDGAYEPLEWAEDRINVSLQGGHEQRLPGLIGQPGEKTVNEVLTIVQPSHRI